MINIILDLKCSIPECNKQYEYIFDNMKYCLKHCPDDTYEIKIKKKCKYCDIEELSTYICPDCKRTQNKKEWGIIRYLRTIIDTPFEYNSSKMLKGCSRKRPDVYFELNKHCIIVEIDEHQHHNYNDMCECTRLNEIVNGIGGKTVIVIRYNPDIIRNKKKIVKIDQNIRLNLLVNTIKKELLIDYDTFCVKLIQLYYNDNYDNYLPYKIEDIINLVCI